MTDLMWSRSKISNAIKRNQVAGIAVVGGTIQFLLGKGDQRGFLVNKDGAIRRFDNESKGWQVIDSMKAVDT